MNRKHLPLVVSLLVLLLTAFSCPISSATSPSQQATLLAQIAQTATALAHIEVSATAQPPTLTETPTEEPPLPPFLDVCKLLDT